MARILNTVLLLALPASGKSEVRRYIEHPDAATRARDFRMGPTVQLDDYPYVHLMRRVDEELEKLGRERVYYMGADRPFRDPFHWGTLIELLNEDYDDLVALRRPVRDGEPAPKSAGMHYLRRVDAAAQRAGARQVLPDLSADLRERLAAALEAEAAEMLAEKNANIPESLEGKTLVIEFSRGGPDGASMPLTPPVGYAYALSRLSDAILSRAAILYIWVAPEESRRKNRARTDPNNPGSILNHGVPEEVMMKDYGCDDMDWMVQQSEKKGAVTVLARGNKYHLPFARFDNRVDKTSFLRSDPATWTPADVASVHAGLKSAFDGMAE